MFIRRIYGTYFAVSMPKCVAKIIDWQKFHIIPEINVSIKNLRIFPCFFKDLSKDPFVKVTKLIIQNRENDAIKLLKNYYLNKNKKANLLSHNYFESSSSILDEKNMYSCMPWANITKKVFHKNIDKVLFSSDMKRKAIEYKFDPEKIGNNQVQSVGVLSEESILVEFERYKFVSKSIRDKGYKKKGNFINGCILKKGKNEVVVVFDGLHKIISLISLGYKKVHVCINSKNNYIDLENISNLNLIENKIAKEDSVRDLLDCIFQGEGII